MSSTGGPIAAPQLVLLRGPELVAGLAGVELDAKVRVTNRNAVDIELGQVSWSVSVGDIEPTTGSQTLGQSVPAHGSRNVVLSIRLPAFDSARVVHAVTDGARAFVADLSVTIKSPWGDRTLRARYAGLLDVSGSTVPVGETPPGPPKTWPFVDD